MADRTINISLPDDLLGEIDDAACADGMTRDEVLREAVRRYVGSRRWRKIRDLGDRTASDLSLSEDGVEGIVDEYRKGAA